MNKRNKSQKSKNVSVTEIKENILELLEGKKKKLVEELVAALELQEEKKKKLVEDLVSALELQEEKKMLIRELASTVEKKFKSKNLPYWKSDFNKAIMDLYDENKIKMSGLGKYATKV